MPLVCIFRDSSFRSITKIRRREWHVLCKADRRRQGSMQHQQLCIFICDQPRNTGHLQRNHLSHASLGEGREFGLRFEFLRRSKNQSENLATDFALSCKGFQSCSNPSGIAKVGRLDSLSGFTKGTYPSLQGIKFRGFSDFQLRGL